MLPKPVAWSRRRGCFVTLSCGVAPLDCSRSLNSRSDPTRPLMHILTDLTSASNDPNSGHVMRSLVIPFALIVLAVGQSSLPGHEGHAPLPTRGASVDPVSGVIRLSREAASILDVTTVESVPQQVSDSWFAYARLTSPWTGRALVSSVVPGRIVSLKVEPGSSVSSGQVLAEVDSQELHSLRQELLTAQNELSLATQLHEQLETAASTGAISGQKLLEARNARERAGNALAIGRQKWLSLGLPDERLTRLLAGRDSEPLWLTLTSPLTGTIIHADLAVGKIADPKEHLFEVIADDKLWLQVDVLEKDLQRVAIGQAVELSLTAYPGRTWTAAANDAHATAGRASECRIAGGGGTVRVG
jgi:cobalt-zinc-cadmium efflux system membrane fusion protein